MQYHRVRELYELQLENEANSIVLQMDPNNVYRTNKSYYVTVPADNARYISEQYESILSDEEILNELIEASGYDCTPTVIRKLVGVSYESMGSPTIWGDYGLKPYHGKVTVRAFGATSEVGEALLSVLDAHVIALHDSYIDNGVLLSYEVLSQSNIEGFSSTVYEAQEEQKKILKGYVNEIDTYKKELSADDMFYYSAMYEPSEEESSPIIRLIKYAILLGAVSCFLICGYYAVRFVFDGHLKTADELREYGLYTIACLETGTPRKADFVDNMFNSGKLPTNSKEYLLNALKAMCDGKTVLCGDAQDENAVEVMNWIASQMENATVTDMLAKDENGLISAKDANCAVLFVRLWNTTAFDLKRELQTLKQIDRTVKGVVVLRGN